MAAWNLPPACTPAMLGAVSGTRSRHCEESSLATIAPAKDRKRGFNVKDMAETERAVGTPTQRSEARRMNANSSQCGHLESSILNHPANCVPRRISNQGTGHPASSWLGRDPAPVGLGPAFQGKRSTYWRWGQRPRPCRCCAALSSIPSLLVTANIATPAPKRWRDQPHGGQPGYDFTRLANGTVAVGLFASATAAVPTIAGGSATVVMRTSLPLPEQREHRRAAPETRHHGDSEPAGPSASMGSRDRENLLR